MSDPRAAGDADVVPFRPDSGVSLGLRARVAARRRARRTGATLTIPPLEARVVHELTLPAGPLRVREIGPVDAPTLLFVHGLLVDGRIWDNLVAELSDRYHCVLPDLPLGAHRSAMAPDADLTPEGITLLLDGIVAALDLDDVTVVASDSGGAITQLWMDRGATRVTRVVLTPCDCFDNFLPPGFSAYQLLARIPGALPAMLASTRLRAVRAMPIAYGGLTHRRIDDELALSWLAPARVDAGIRRVPPRDLGPAAGRGVAAAGRLRPAGAAAVGTRAGLVPDRARAAAGHDPARRPRGRDPRQRGVRQRRPPGRVGGGDRGVRSGPRAGAAVTGVLFARGEAANRTTVARRPSSVSP